MSPSQELTSVREENEKLKQVRTTMDDELHTLTENLFEVCECDVCVCVCV